jgi:hypothetical protein
MQGIHVVNCDFKHDFALVWRNRTNGFAQVSDLLSLSNSFLRLNETHELWKLSLFECSNDEYVFHHFLAKEMNEIHALDSKQHVKPTLLVDPTGQKPNNINPDLVR